MADVGIPLLCVGRSMKEFKSRWKERAIFLLQPPTIAVVLTAVEPSSAGEGSWIPIATHLTADSEISAVTL